MKLISFDKIRQLQIDPLDCYKWVDEALRCKEKAILPAKISLKPGIPGVFYNTMPSILPEQGWGGVKLVTRYPDRKPSLDSQMLLYDIRTGENVALLDGNWITAMRTGAVAAHSIQLFAKKNFSNLGFIGLGNTARATMCVLLRLYPEAHWTVKLKKYKNQHELFAKRFENSKLKFVYCDTYEEVVCGSDVVVSAATVFEEDICENECFEKGILLVPIHTRGFTNCDLFFDKIFADDVNHVKGFKYFSQYRYFAEVGDVLTGAKTGRENDSERIIAYNIGISLHDIFFAGKIYELLKSECEDVSLNSPTEKFWI